MVIFREKCNGEEYKNNHFFIEWHNAIKKDLNRFKIILEQYSESKEKNKLLATIDYIINNVSNEFCEDDSILMKSTEKYFLFSFYDTVAEMPTYVLISKDYKRLLIASEEMECFDDKNFNEDERYGYYNYYYFFLKDNKVTQYYLGRKEYTQDYSEKFDNSYFCVGNVQESDQYYSSLLNEQNIVKKLARNS